MAPARDPNLLSVIATMDDHRRAGRLRVQNVRAAHGKVQGTVLDISKTGARICCASKPTFKDGDQIGISVACGEVSVTLRAQVVWMRAVSKREHLVGLAFSELNENEAAMVLRIARIGREALSAAQSRFPR